MNMSVPWLTSPHDLDAPEDLVTGSVNGSHLALNWEEVFFPPSAGGLLYRLILLSYTVWVIIGNSLVCIGTVKAYKFGQVCPIYLCYVSSLDVLVGVCLLPTMTIIKLVGYFPYSSIACNVFVYWDYYIICAASFGHFTLIFFFYWEINSPGTVPRALTFHLKICVSIFLAVNIVWMPAYFADLMKAEPKGAPAGSDLSPSRSCGFSSHNNHFGAIFLGIFGFLLPYIGGFACCTLSIRTLWKRYHRLIRDELQVEYTKFRERKKEHHHHHHHGYQQDHRQHHIHSHNQGGHAHVARPVCIEYTSTVNGTNLEKQLQPHEHADHEVHGILHEAILVVAIYFLFSSLRIPFYLYYIAGIFNSQHFPQDLSIGIYWIMDINSVLSCCFHLTLEPTVRKGVKEVFCNCRRKRNVAHEDDNVETSDRWKNKVMSNSTSEPGQELNKLTQKQREISTIDLSKGLPWPYIH